MSGWPNKPFFFSDPLGTSAFKEIYGPPSLPEGRSAERQEPCLKLHPPLFDAYIHFQWDKRLIRKGSKAGFSGGPPPLGRAGPIAPRHWSPSKGRSPASRRPRRRGPGPNQPR